MVLFLLLKLSPPPIDVFLGEFQFFLVGLFIVVVRELPDAGPAVTFKTGLVNIDVQLVFRIEKPDRVEGK